MIRPENVRVAKSDPATAKRLAELRSSFEGLHQGALTVAAAQARAAEVAASRARRSQVFETHARLEAGLEAGRRAPDRAYYLRPYNNMGKDLWEHSDLRAWYSGGVVTGTLQGPDFGGAALGATLMEAGYTMPASRSLPPPPNPYRHDAPASPHPAAALNTTRAALEGAWRHSANDVHWLEREALLPVERAAAVAQRDAFFSQGLVKEAQPFKPRPSEEDSHRFQAPQPAALREAFLTARAEGAKAGVGNAASARATKMSAFATDPSNFY
jgi:hypothetical protein